MQTFHENARKFYNMVSIKVFCATIWCFNNVEILIELKFQFYDQLVIFEFKVYFSVRDSKKADWLHGFRQLDFEIKSRENFTRQYC